MSKLNDDLLEAAAEALDDGRDPFSTAFLCDNDVSLEDCMGLSTLLAVLLRAYLYSPWWARKAMLVSGALGNKGLAEIIWNQIRMEEVMKSLKKVPK